MRYPIVATLVAVSACAFCFGAAVDDFWSSPAETIRDYQTLIAALVAIPTVYAAFQQMDQNRRDRQADRRFVLAPRIEATRVVLDYASRARRGMTWGEVLMAVLRAPPQPPNTAILKQAEIAGARVSEAMERVRLGFAGELAEHRSPMNQTLQNATFAMLGVNEQDQLTQGALTDAIKACNEQLNELELMITGQPK